MNEMTPYILLLLVVIGLQLHFNHKHKIVKYESYVAGYHSGYADGESTEGYEKSISYRDGYHKGYADGRDFAQKSE